MQPLKLSLKKIAEVSGESIPTIYSAIEAGHLTTFLVGRRRFARLTAVEAWLEFLEKQSNAGKPVCYRPRSSELAARAV